MSIFVKGIDMVYVGRIRKDIFLENGLLFYIIVDNICKGVVVNVV